MKRFLFFILMIAIAIPIFAQNATIERISGKVEYLVPGGVWTSARVGDIIPLGATISTGFKSSAVLAVGGSEISVLALTRMSIEDLTETSDSVTTSLNLRTGKVRASVRSTEGKSTDFTLRSPVSTAAVRGTEFIFDGYRLEVIEGIVTFLNRLNESTLVQGGNASETNGDDSPSYPEDNQQNNSTVTTDTSGTPAGTGYTGAGTTGNLVIVIGS
ncbi:MAG: FecR domain-containing protein [Spirochaetales bacterium]|nr:FecR domain-containing protein [Spirochaetales bacterium]